MSRTSGAYADSGRLTKVTGSSTQAPGPGARSTWGAPWLKNADEAKEAATVNKRGSRGRIRIIAGILYCADTVAACIVDVMLSTVWATMDGHFKVNSA